MKFSLAAVQVVVSIYVDKNDCFIALFEDSAEVPSYIDTVVSGPFPAEWMVM